MLLLPVLISDCVTCNATEQKLAPKFLRKCNLWIYIIDGRVMCTDRTVLVLTKVNNRTYNKLLVQVHNRI